MRCKVSAEGFQQFRIIGEIVALRRIFPEMEELFLVAGRVPDILERTFHDVVVAETESAGAFAEESGPNLSGFSVQKLREALGFVVARERLGIGKPQRSSTVAVTSSRETSSSQVPRWSGMFRHAMKKGTWADPS